MTRVLLVAANTMTDPYAVYPIGMSVVAAALLARGHEVRQFDLLAAGDSMVRLVDEVRAFGPDMVGLSLRNIDDCDSFSRMKPMARERGIVESVRKATDAPVVLGGSAFSLMPEEILAALGADAGVVGEGERAAVDLADAVARGERPSGIVRGAAHLADGEIMGPAIDPGIAAFHKDASGMINCQTKRGCPHGCAYCTYPALEGGAFRTRDPRGVVEELARITVEAGTATVCFTDSIFNDTTGHHLEVAEAIVRSGLAIHWSAFFRPERIAPGEIDLLRRSGLYAVEFGTDAASDATMEGLGKGFCFSDVAAATFAFATAGVPVGHFIMFGGPGETPETVTEGLGNIAKLAPCVVFGFSGIRILPGTRMERIAIADGLMSPGEPLLSSRYYHSPAIDRARMETAVTAAFAGRRDRIFPPSEGRVRMEVMRRFGHTGLLWDKLVRVGGSPGGAA
jgi:lipid biosynthesis B12-binding/radical SAM protein